MQDFTTGSLSRHLLKTMSFMLVTMLFQTLYVLVDLSSAVRIVLVAVPLYFLAYMAGFELSVATVWLQMTLNLVLLSREYRRRLSFDAVAAV